MNTQGHTLLLVVDAGGDELSVLEQLISEHAPGCNVVLASSGPQGLAIAAAKPVHFAVIDLQGPEMSGLDMCRRLAAANTTCGIHVILVVGQDAEGATRAQALNAGASHLISRPVHGAELIALVAALKRVTGVEDELNALNQHMDEWLRGQTRQLTESEERFRGVFEGVTDGILLADQEGAFVMANEAMCRMVGYSVEELLCRGVQDLHPVKELYWIRELFRKQLADEVSLAPDIPVVRKDGSVFFADVTATPITFDENDYLVGTFRDTTERNQLQASLAQSDRLASMGMLAAGVAHEINNPLTYVLFNLETLGEDLALIAASVKRGKSMIRGCPGVDIKDVLERTEESLEGAYQIRDIVQALGTFSSVDGDELIEVDLHDAIEFAANMAHNELKYRAKLVKDYGDVPTILATEGQLSQVFLNLLMNASQAIDEGDVAHNEIRIRSWAEGHDIFVQVADTGKGIPAENLSRIMEPFFTTKDVGEGSGLGLTICHNIVRSFGGDIRAESEVGRGTRITLQFQALENQQHPDPTVGAEDGHARRDVRGRVLVVDDDENLRATLKRALSRHEVVTASSGGEGQKILRDDDSFDVLICDIMMPEMSGMDLHEWLLERKNSLASRTVFMTGGLFTSRARDYLRAVDVPSLKKPLDMEELLELVARRITRSRMDP